MHLIKATIRPDKLESVRQHLIEIGVLGMTASECSGHGKEGPTTRSFRDEDRAFRVLQSYILIEVVVPKSQMSAAVEAITRSARDGRPGSGKIFVSPIEHVVRVRTGETDTDALMDDKLAV